MHCLHLDPSLPKVPRETVPCSHRNSCTNYIQSSDTCLYTSILIHIDIYDIDKLRSKDFVEICVDNLYIWSLIYIYILNRDCLEAYYKDLQNYTAVSSFNFRDGNRFRFWHCRLVNQRSRTTADGRLRSSTGADQDADGAVHGHVIPSTPSFPKNVQVYLFIYMFSEKHVQFLWKEPLSKIHMPLSVLSSVENWGMNNP